MKSVPLCIIIDGPLLRGPLLKSYLAAGETPGLVQVGGQPRLDPYRRLVQRLARTPAASVARLEGVAEDDIDPAAQRRQCRYQPSAALGASQDGHGHDRRPAAYREVREPGTQGGEVALAPGALGKDPERPALLQHAEGVGDGGAVDGR